MDTKRYKGKKIPDGIIKQWNKIPLNGKRQLNQIKRTMTDWEKIFATQQKSD